MLNPYRAVSTPLTLTDSTTKLAKVELGSFDRPEFTLKVTLTNYSDKAKTLRPNLEVMTPIQEKQGNDRFITPSNLVLAHTAQVSDVVIPAKGSKDLTLKVSLPLEVSFQTGEAPIALKESLINGFLRFTEAGNNKIAVQIPFLGFYGNWDAMCTLDYMKGFEAKQPFFSFENTSAGFYSKDQKTQFEKLLSLS